MSFGVKPHGKIEKLPCGGTEEIVPPGDNVERAGSIGKREEEQVAAVALPRDGDGRDDGEAKSGGDKIFDALRSFSRAATWSASVFSPAARRKSSAERWLPLPFSRSRSGCDCKSAASGIFCALAAENSGVFGAMSTMAS